MGEKEFGGLEIVGKLLAWTLEVEFPGRPKPTMSLEYKPVEEVIIGEEAAKQLAKWQDIPLHKKGKHHLYARCRVDFYVVDD